MNLTKHRIIDQAPHVNSDGPEGEVIPTATNSQPKYRARYRVVSWRHNRRSPLVDHEYHSLDGLYMGVSQLAQAGAAALHIQIYRTKI